jgi:hypothetical protein
MSTVSPETAPLDPGSMECRELLDRVVNSRELKRALRLRDLLCYLGKRSQSSPTVILREQEIGAAVFGRPDDYDTGMDNIVRVNVSELRKRLAHFFQDEGADETIVIEIPRGAYLPVFLLRAHVAKDIPAGPPAAVSAVGLNGASAGAPVGTVAVQGPSRHVVVPLVVTLILALGVCDFLMRENHRLALELQPWKADSTVASFWSDFFAPGQEVDVVIADTSFAMAEDIVGRTISLDDYLDYKYKSVEDDPGISADTRFALRQLLNRNNGSIGDFQAAERFIQLGGNSPGVKLVSARSYSAERIKTSNVILIGGRESNPWVELYKDRMNFFMAYEPSTKRSYVANRDPQPGEAAVYEALQDPNKSYSVVAFLPNPGDRSYALIIAGIDSQSTRAAGEFIASPEGLAQIRQKMPIGPFPYFELVLSSSRRVGTTLRTEIVASRLRQR